MTASDFSAALARESAYWRGVIRREAGRCNVDPAKLAQKMHDRWADGDSLMAIACCNAANTVINEEMEGLDLGR